MELNLYQVTYKRWSNACWYKETMLSVGTSDDDAIKQAKAILATQHGHMFLNTTLGQFEATLIESVMGHRIIVK